MLLVGREEAKVGAHGAAACFDGATNLMRVLCVCVHVRVRLCLVTDFVELRFCRQSIERTAGRWASRTWLFSGSV